MKFQINEHTDSLLGHVVVHSFCQLSEEEQSNALALHGKDNEGKQREGIDVNLPLL